MAFASSKKGWGQVYNLGGSPVSLIDFVKRAIEIAKTGSDPVLGYCVRPFPKDRKKIEVGDYVADWSKIRKTYGWEPKISLEEGLKRTIDWYRENMQERLWKTKS